MIRFMQFGLVQCLILLFWIWQIDKFEDLYLEVEKFEQEIVFEKWFRLDMRPFRQALLNTTKKWSLMFKQYMIDSVIGGYVCFFSLQVIKIFKTNEFTNTLGLE